MVKGLSESEPSDSGLATVCCVFANAASQLSGGRIHLVNGLGQNKLICNNGGSQRRSFILGLSRKKSEYSEDSLRFSLVKLFFKKIKLWRIGKT